MMHVEIQERLANDEESRIDARHFLSTTSCVCVFVALEMALTVLAGYVLLEKVKGDAPFSRTGSLNSR